MHHISLEKRARLSSSAGTMAVALGVSLFAGQLVTTPAVASVTTGTAAAAAAVSVKPRIRVAASPRTIGWGSTSTVTARPVDPRTGRAVRSGSVRLQAYRGGAWRTWATKRVAARGYVSFSTGPRTTSIFRTQYTGAARYRWATSTTIRVIVRSSGARIIAEAQKHRGKAYRFGASGPRTFDCSGFTMYVYKTAAGKKLPHKADLQQRLGRRVSKANARLGDLVVVRSGSYGTHAGIYAGGGYMWASPRSGRTVDRQRIWTTSYVVQRLL